MGKRGLLLLSIVLTLLLIPNVLALDVFLSNSPENGKTYIFLDQSDVIIHFKCRALIKSNENLDSIRLFTNISGTYQQTGDPKFSPGNNTLVDFAVTGIPTGTYEWNCKANGLVFAPQNQVFSIFVEPNNPPVFRNTIQDYTWNQGTSLPNAFDLDTYFSDPDNDTLTYGYTGLSSNLRISINQENQVSFSQIEGWFGDGGTVTFTATDGDSTTNSNQVRLTVKQAQANNAPQITPTIPEQIKESDIQSWNLDLSNYVTDDKDQKSQIIWTVSDVNSSLITATISGSIITFNHITNQYGVDDINITAKDTSGLTSNQILKVTIKSPQSTQPSNQSQSQTQNTTTQEEEEEVEDLTNIIPVIRSSIPAGDTQIVEPGQEKIFMIEPSDKSLDTIWYLDGRRVSESTEYTFKPTSDGEHNLTAVVTNGVDSDSKEWKILSAPEQEITSENSLSICGNNQQDEDETCSSCPLDVICQDGFTCQDNQCVEQKSGNSFLAAITGGVTGLSPTIKNNWYYPVGGLAALFLLFVSSKIMKKTRRKDVALSTFHKKESFLRRLQRRLREADQRRQELKRKKLLETAHLKNEQTNVELIAPTPNQIIHFIRESLSQGHNKRAIKKALKKHGWNRKQIRLGFNNLDK